MMDLRVTTAPYVDSTAAEGFAEPTLPSGFVVIRLDGRKMLDLDGLFRAYVREFRFPEYFGWNWAAFDECLTDLRWYPAYGYVTIIDHAARLLENQPGELGSFVSALESAGRIWARSFALGKEFDGGEVPFHTMFLV